MPTGKLHGTIKNPLGEITEMWFNGPEYVPERDQVRLGTQIYRVWEALSDHEWHSIQEISKTTGDPENSVSAQFRHLRKKRFGSHTVDRKHLGNGFYHYRLRPEHDDV